mmetsp:Transcript_30458/g.81519  ORF Transcript_30458/g.81519 Transcript_30458/m.81519 type:complete len:303 (+) Transcript_30458:144-1052(+)
MQASARYSIAWAEGARPALPSSSQGSGILLCLATAEDLLLPARLHAEGSRTLGALPLGSGSEALPAVSALTRLSLSESLGTSRRRCGRSSKTSRISWSLVRSKVSVRNPGGFCRSGSGSALWAFASGGSSRVGSSCSSRARSTCLHQTITTTSTKNMVTAQAPRLATKNSTLSSRALMPLTAASWLMVTVVPVSVSEVAVGVVEVTVVCVVIWLPTVVVNSRGSRATATASRPAPALLRNSDRTASCGAAARASSESASAAVVMTTSYATTTLESPTSPLEGGATRRRPPPSSATESLEISE